MVNQFTLLYRCGPDVEGLVEREELLHCEPWEVSMYHLNHLNEREDVYQKLLITNHEAVSHIFGDVLSVLLHHTSPAKEKPAEVDGRVVSSDIHQL